MAIGWSMSSKKITITDVAEHAGVSVTTVSLVLSGKGRISEKTAVRVNKAIEALGYIRNQQAAMLRGGGSNVIGLIVSDISEPFYAEVAAGIGEILDGQGKVLFLTQCGRNGRNLDRCFDSLSAYGVDGVIIGSGRFLNDVVKQKARDVRLPLVCAARASEFDDIDVIRPDNSLAAKVATEHLIKHGHRQIAYLGGEGGSLTRAERLGGFCAALLQYGLPFRPEWMVECDCRQQASAQAAQELLTHNPEITAILCHKASVALGAYFGVLGTGYTVGKDNNESYFTRQVALIGFGDVPEAELTNPPLTFISSSAREIGHSAANRLLQRIEMPDEPPQHIILPPKLIARGSV
ncbi:LacI family transcriptional regulator [Enterobacillus tribolii]|uniref:LacI family transcriptional regulator n=2 Tax=Enterobacillus tribolii TaxID=1487935 RepID=A0A370R3Z2_9GAMM|nr:LacI family transcriptional regulator [Enterobacillus tribolii]